MQWNRYIHIILFFVGAKIKTFNEKINLKRKKKLSRFHFALRSLNHLH